MNQAAISIIAAYGLLLNGPYKVAVYARTYLLRSQAGAVLEVTESWAGPGNEAR